MISNTLSHATYEEFSSWLAEWTEQQKKDRQHMATMTNVKVNKASLRKMYKQWERGERSKSEIERTEFGNRTAKGKFVTRLWQARLGLDSVRALRVSK